MRLWALAAAVVCITVGIIGSVVVANLAADYDAASEAAAQLRRLENVRTAVVEADSAATAAYLEGGLESPSRRRSYESSLATAQSVLVEASTAARDGSDRLGEASAALTEAAGMVEQARANSRQGFPVGAAYQRTASASIRTDVVPALDRVASAARSRTVDEAGRGGVATLLVALGGVASLGMLAAASRWMSRRTRRLLNPGLVAGMALVAVSTFAALATIVGADSTAVDTLETSYSSATAYAQARTAAFDARSNEALTLIARGNGAVFEAAWEQQAETARRQLDRAAATDPAGDSAAESAFDDYADLHRTIRSAEDSGEYARAVDTALGVGTDGDGFARFDDASSQALERLADATTASLDDARSGVSNHRWYLLVAGFAAAGAAFAGIARRIEEYR